MMNKEPPSNTIAWYFYKIEEKQKQLQFLLSNIEQNLVKVKELLNEIDTLRAQLESSINVGKI